MCAENNASNISKGAKVGFNIIIYFFLSPFFCKNLFTMVFLLQLMPLSREKFLVSQTSLQNLSQLAR
jgi:hypothetical protein